MNNDWFDGFFTTYYLLALTMWIVAFIGFTICIYQIYKKGHTTSRITFLGYFASVLLQGVLTILFAYVMYPVYGENARSVNVFSEYAFAAVEFGIFSILFHHILMSKKAKSLVLIGALFWLLGCILFFPPLISNPSNSYRTSIMSGFLGISYCLVYFYELFYFAPTKNLTMEPAFWTVTGILIYLVCLTPNLLVLQFVPQYDFSNYAPLLYINFFASTSLYFFFIKALLCKTYQVTSL